MTVKFNFFVEKHAIKFRD